MTINSGTIPAPTPPKKKRKGLVIGIAAAAVAALAIGGTVFAVDASKRSAYDNAVGAHTEALAEVANAQVDLPLAQYTWVEEWNTTTGKDGYAAQVARIAKANEKIVDAKATKGLATLNDALTDLNAEKPKATPLAAKPDDQALAAHKELAAALKEDPDATVDVTVEVSEFKTTKDGADYGDAALTEVEKSVKTSEAEAKKLTDLITEVEAETAATQAIIADNAAAIDAAAASALKLQADWKKSFTKADAKAFDAAVAELTKVTETEKPVAATTLTALNGYVVEAEKLKAAHDAKVAEEAAAAEAAAAQAAAEAAAAAAAQAWTPPVDNGGGGAWNGGGGGWNPPPSNNNGGGGWTPPPPSNNNGGGGGGGNMGGNNPNQGDGSSGCWVANCAG